MLDWRLFFNEEKEVTGKSLPAISVSAGPDDGSSDKLARYYATTFKTTIHRHTSTKQAIGNILVRQESSDIILAGHGSVSMFETGKGQGYSDDVTKRVSEGTRDYWEDEFQKIYDAFQRGYKISTLEIFSCDTGAEESGAYLLWLIAKIADLREVKARTGISTLYSDGRRQWIAYENDSHWQKASNDMYEPPLPINLPMRQRHTTINNFFQIIDGGVVKDIQYKSVIEIIVTNALGSIYIEKISEFLKKFFYTEQFEFDGILFAETTSTVTIRNEDTSFVINIYNHRFGVIRGFKSAFYVGDLNDI